MRENIVVICPTPQAAMHAAEWHDGQLVHGAHAGIARRARCLIGFTSAPGSLDMTL
jgi:hypothetical protein